MTLPFKNYRLTIAYDGTQYHGWQIQPNGISIQEIIENTLKILLKRDIHIIGSGRTDAGVHAKAQIAHFKYYLDENTKELDLYKMMASLNGILPLDIRIKKIEEAPTDFHSQYSAKGKIYHYHICLDKIQEPFNRLYSWHMHWPIDRKLLFEATQLFIGTHDFTSFANEAHRGSASKDPVRTIQRLDVIDEEGGIRLEFEADGFLYKMVRNIVGMLIQVASGKEPLDRIKEVFVAKNRQIAPQSAPPQGLFLYEVKY